MKKIVVITGKAGAGKSTVCRKISENNPHVLYIDGDHYAESCLADSQVIMRMNDQLRGVLGKQKLSSKEIASAFHKEDAVSNVVFSLFIKEVEIKILETINSIESDNVIILLDWFLLEKSELFNIADIRIMLECNQEIRLNRVIKRGNMKETTFFKNEKSHCEKNKPLYDFIINTEIDNWQDVVERYILGVEPMLTVIVPVYNSEKTISRCLNSIVNQTYNNIEIIVVDDGSSDNTVDVVNNMAKKYENIKLIHTKHKGVVNARNVGIENANGEYIGFVDSDDYIDSNMYKVLMHNMLQYNADISSCRAFLYKRDTDQISNKTFEAEKVYEFSDKEKAVRAFVEGGISIAVWDKVIRKDMVVSFNKSYFSEDAKYVWDLLTLNEEVKVVVTSRQLYHYVKHTGSLTSGEITKEHLSIAKFGEECATYILEKYNDKELANMMLYNAYAHLLKLVMKAYRFGKNKLTDAEVLVLVRKLKDLKEVGTEKEKNHMHNINNIMEIFTMKLGA